MPEKHAAGYVRVSSEEQAAHGISVDAQRAILEGWAAMTQAGPLVVYQDPGFSGKNTARPALQRLLADVRAGAVSVVVVWKLDRLSRSLRDTLAIIEDVLQPHGVALVSTTESIDTATPAGRMMLNMLASFAQLEREQDSDRVLMAHKHLAEDCRYLGGHIPLGYRVDDSRHYQLDPVTAPVVRRAFEMYLSRAGYAAMLEFLNIQAPAFYRRRSPWKKSDVNYMLSNEFYAGTYRRQLGRESVRVPGGVPAILTPEEWTRVCSMRAENQRLSGLYRARTVYPLAGLVRCGVCGRVMPLRHGGKDRAGAVERYYTCHGHCVPPIRLEALEAAVLDAVEMLSAQGDALRRACHIANGYADGRDADRAADAPEVEDRLLRLRRRMAQIVAYIADAGSAAPRSLADELHRLEADEAALVEKLSALRRPSGRYNPDAMAAALSACRGIKENAPEQQRQLLQGALHAVEVHPDEIRLALACLLDGGDDPPAYIRHATPRKKGGQRRPRSPFQVTPARSHGS